MKYALVDTIQKSVHEVRDAEWVFPNDGRYIVVPFNEAEDDVKPSAEWSWDSVDGFKKFIPPPPPPVDPSPGSFDVLQFLIDRGVINHADLPPDWRSYTTPRP